MRKIINRITIVFFLLSPHESPLPRC